MRTLAWRALGALPESMRRAVRPALAAVRRRRRLHTPATGGEPPELPPEAVELDTAIGTLWFDGADERLAAGSAARECGKPDVMKLPRRTRGRATCSSTSARTWASTTVLAASCVGPAGKVVAVEPTPWALDSAARERLAPTAST